MEILVLGDGRFVFTVLNAVASIDAYRALGAAGALIGIVIILLRGVTSPQGPQLNLAPILLSIVFFWVMFIPRVDRVLITEILPPPGSMDPRSYVVDNVPLGLAGAGYLVSNIGVKISGLYDDVMSRPNDSERIMQGGGLGRNLMLLSMIREMVADPRFGQVDFGETNAFLNYRRDMGAYMENCVLPPVNNGYIPSATVLSKPVQQGVFNEAFGLQKRWVWQHWAAPAGSMSYEREQVTCAAARERLLAELGSSALVDGFDDALKKTRTGASTDEIMAAYANAAGEDGLSMQEKIVGHMTSVLLRDSQIRGAMTSADRQAITMLEEANMRRSTQWSAEENLFIRLLRPIVGFFEALFYALGPIMAFVMMLGPTGWSLLMKYLMLTVWVALWFPMLAITNLYSKIKMEDFFARLGTSDLSPNDLDLIANEAMNTLGATSALVAATPALAMSLIYGGAVSMSYLAGRLNHNDVVDETKMAPQLGTVAPVQQTQSHAVANAGEGGTLTGRSSYVFDEAQQAQTTARSAESFADSTSASAQRDVFDAVSAGFRFGTSGGTFGTTSESVAAAKTFQNAIKTTDGESTSVTHGAALLRNLSDSDTNIVAVARDYAINKGVSLGAAIAKVGGSLGYDQSYIDQLRESTGTSNSLSDTEQLNNSRAINDAFTFAFSKDTSLQSGMTRAHVAEMGAKFATTGEAVQGTETGERLSRSFQQASEARRVYETTTADSWQSGRSVSMKGGEFLRRLEDEGVLADWTVKTTAFLNSVSDPDGRLTLIRESELEAVRASNVGARPHSAALANLAVLTSGDGIPSERRLEALALASEGLRHTTMAGVGGATSGAGSNNAGQVGVDAQRAGGTWDTTAGVESNRLPDRADVRTSTTGAITSSTGNVQTANADLGVMANGAGVSSSEFSNLEREREDALFDHAGRRATANADHIARDKWRDFKNLNDEAAAKITQEALAAPYEAALSTRSDQDYGKSLVQMGEAARNLAQDYPAYANQLLEAQKPLYDALVEKIDSEHPYSTASEAIVGDVANRNIVSAALSVPMRGAAGIAATMDYMDQGLRPGQAAAMAGLEVHAPNSNFHEIIAVRDIALQRGDTDVAARMDARLPGALQIPRGSFEKNIELGVQYPK